LAGLEIVRDVFGFVPNAVQEDVLTGSTRRLLLACARQWGKSTVAAALIALRVMAAGPRGVVVCVSPTLRQTRELLLKTMENLRRAGVLERAALSGSGRMELQVMSGARVVALPADEETLRGVSAPAMVVIDEAAMVDDAVYKALRPMLSSNDGDLVLLSTPKGQRGFFWREWQEGGAGWRRVLARATECARYKPEVLEEERRVLGEVWFRQEYLCEFTVSEDAAFREEWLERAQARGEDWEPVGGGWKRW
jgi:hypothetical protein